MQRVAFLHTARQARRRSLVGVDDSLKMTICFARLIVNDPVAEADSDDHFLV